MNDFNAGPHPVPEGAHLSGITHGTKVSQAQALSLAALSEFVEDWVIYPSPDGSVLRLMWGDTCTTEELQHVNEWNTATMTALKAQHLPSGSACLQHEPDKNLAGEEQVFPFKCSGG